MKIIGEEALIECDKYDYYASAFSGLISGLIDAFFVEAPGEGLLGDLTEEQTDNLVKKCAEWTGWSPRKGNEDSIKSALGSLEGKFKVNYDISSANFDEHGFSMGTKNHHIKSLAHSPDPIGALFSIIDQFTDSASFISNGQLISIRDKTCDLQGGDLKSRIFCGLCNWLFHLVSDVAGSTGSRGHDGSGRGSGLPLPFFNMFLACDFGEFQIGKERKNFAELMTRVFQEGYDLRHGAAMAIPVVINDLFIRVFWAIKRHYYHKLEWEKCFPWVDKNRSLHKMMLVSNGSLCLVDGVDAYIRSGGNPLAFMLHLNILAWARFVTLIFKYIAISNEKIEYERKHIYNQEKIKKLEEDTIILERDLKRFLQEQQLVIDSNFRIVVKAIAVGDVDATGTALNNIANLFGDTLPFTTFEEGVVFMNDPNSVLEL